MAIDVSGMTREEKLAALAPAVHQAIAKKKAEGTYHQEMKNPVFQAKGIVTFRNNDLPRSALTDITDHVVGSVVLPKNKSQLLAAPPAAMANFQDATPESQQGRHIAEATLESYQKRPHAKTQEQKDYEARLQQGETGAGAGTPPQDETLIRLQQQAAQEKKENDASAAAFSAYHDRYIHDQDAQDLDAMTPEERKTLTSYGNYLKLQRADASSGMGPEPGEEEAVPREYQDLVEKYGASRLAELYETASRDAALEQRQQVQQAAQRQSQGAVKGTLASAATVPVSLVGGPVALMSRLKDSQNSTGRYNSLSPYTAGDALNVWSDSVRQNVGQQIAGDGSNVLRQGASILYQAGMGTVDSVAKAIVLGPTAAAATSAMGSYARTLSDASEKGATASQAVLLASAQAALDYAMDKIPLDQLAGLAKSGSTSALKAALKQAGIEVTTEGASFLGSQLLEMEILRENSEYQRNISNYMAQGATVQEATAQANKDLAAQAGQQMLVAGLSGGVSAGVSTAIGNARNRRAQALLDSETDAAPDAAPAEPAPEQPTAQQEVPPVDTAPASTADQLLQNPQQLPQEPVARRPVQSQQKSASPIDTVSRMAEDIGSNATARQQQAQENLRSVQDQVAALTGDPAAAAQPDTLGMQSEPSGDVEKSRTVTNSGLHNEDSDIRAGYRETLRQDPDVGDYQVKHNADTLDTAQQRTSSPERVRAEYDYLMSKGDSWTAEDVATGRLVAKKLFKSGDVEGVTAMNKQLAKVGTNAGQVAQAFAISGTMKDASDPMSASESATARFLAMDQGDTTYKKTKNGPTFEQWQKNIAQEYTRIAMAVDNVPDGDVKAMRDVIRQIAQSRKTTAWFGTSSRLTKNAQRILNKLDFDTLKKIANTQIAAMPDDFRARGKMEVAEGLRKQGMLSSLKTFERNLAGNSATGLLDSFSDSIGGRFVDSLMAKATGKRTVGNDLKLPGKYLSAARDSMDFASLCVELNVPIETDANAAFDSATGANGSGKYIGKTFRSNGNVAMRVLYGYQKYMSYALEVSDKVFEGGTNAAVTDSLNRLKNSNLSDADISELAEFTANRRTFKDATWEENGKTHGSNLSRVAQQMKNIGKGTDAEPFTKAVGDVVMPFASVPMNVAQTGIDYTAGVGKGAIEIARIIHDARHGKEISVARQRQAASDFGRGMTGLAFIGIMTTAAANGIIQVHDDSDKNKKALDQSQGLSGAQINWSALGRASEGGSEKWQTGDVVTSLDFLEPFNTQMYLAVELAQDDAVKEFMANPSFNLAGVGKAYAKSAFPSVVSSFMDSPMMDGLTQLQDMLSNGYDAVKSGDTGDLKNALAEYGGNVASSFVPQFVRQTAQTMDGYYRDTRGKDSAEYAKNSILNAIPGASESLPKKVNGFGQEQKRGGFVTNFLDPTNTHRLQLDETAQALDELSQNPDVKNIYPERQAPLKVKDASGEDVQLTGEQRETYQKEYGKRVKEYYDGLLKNSNFDKLPDEMKAEALQKAKEYGTQFARAAVTDYKDVPKDGGKTSIVFNTVRDVLKSNAASAVGDLEKAWELGNDTKKATDTLNTVYDTISEMSNATKASVLKKSGGNTRIYLEARNSGLPSDKTLSIIKAVQSIPEENRDKRPVQLQSVAETKGLSDTQLDTVMKLYMPDYDPKDKESDKTEVKYDYIRRELGLSAKEYADTYYAYLYADTNGDGKTKKGDSVQGIIDLGFDKKMAEQLYQIYKGSSNSAKATLKKFIEENY